jgi:hypothetical protein
MDDQNTESNPQPAMPAPEKPDEREQRSAERDARSEARWQRRGSRRHSWVWGIVLVLLGLMLLLDNVGIPFLANWWALFILVPAFWCYAGAWDSYQINKRLTRRAAVAMIIGLLLTALALVFLFNVAFSVYWPVLLIAGGVGLLLTALLPA